MSNLEAWKQSTLTRKSHKSTSQYDYSPGMFKTLVIVFVAPLRVNVNVEIVENGKHSQEMLDVASLLGPSSYMIICMFVFLFV